MFNYFKGMKSALIRAVRNPIDLHTAQGAIKALRPNVGNVAKGMKIPANVGMPRAAMDTFRSPLARDIPGMKIPLDAGMPGRTFNPSVDLYSGLPKGFMTPGSDPARSFLDRMTRSGKLGLPKGAVIDDVLNNRFTDFLRR